MAAASAAATDIDDALTVRHGIVCVWRGGGGVITRNVHCSVRARPSICADRTRRRHCDIGGACVIVHEIALMVCWCVAVSRYTSARRVCEQRWSKRWRCGVC
jgi:hypothetical protein